MSLISLLVTVVDDMSVSLVTPGVQSPDGYVKLEVVRKEADPNAPEPSDVYLHFRIHCPTGLNHPAKRRYEEGLVARHVANMLHLEGLQDQLRIVKVSWYP